MKKLMIYILILLPAWGFSQVQLKGIVNDRLASIAGANVIVNNLAGEIITGAVTKADGSFLISLKTGNYKMKISSIGFLTEERTLQLENDTDLGVIILKEEAGNLNEIKISAKKKLITYKSDRIVYDVENSVSAAGGNAVNAITAAPGIILKNNTLSMLGKGSSRVMINGRLIELTGEDLLNYLNSIAVAEIKSVEVIANPPANYEASGDGGLINIILKKGVNDSWKNSATLTYEQNKYSSFTMRDNFLYNKNKVKLSASVATSLGKSNVKQDLTTYYPTGPWELSYQGKQKKNNYSGRMAIDYDVSKNTVIGLQYMGDHNSPGSSDYTRINILNNTNSLDSLLVNTGFRDQSSVSHTANAHLLSKLDTLGRKISFDFDYFSFNTKTDKDFLANTYLPDFQFLNTNLSARNISNQKIDNYSIKLDMEHPLKFINLSYGAKASVINSEADIEYYNTITGKPALDPDRSNTFNYKEKNMAVYVNGTKNIKTRLSLQLGLRLENTQTDGYSGTLNQANHNNYLQLFPTFYLTYKANESNSYQFNYGKRINRPGFGILNPFRSYLNSNSYSEGNPFLQPSFTESFDFTHTYKGKLRTNLFFNTTTDGFGPVFTSNPQTNSLILTRQNYFKEFYYGAGEDYTVNITPWWQSNNLAYILASKSKFLNTINATPKNGAQFYLSTNNTFSLGQSTKLEVDYYYSSSYKRGLYEFGSTSGLNLALKQSLLKNNLQLSLMVNDVLNTAFLKDYTSVVNGIKQVYNENNSSRFFRFSITYNFGNDKINVKERDFGNKDEQKRTN